jgi:hypothetical protein
VTTGLAGKHADGEGEQALAGGTGQLSERDGDPFGQHQLGRPSTAARISWMSTEGSWIGQR